MIISIEEVLPNDVLQEIASQLDGARIAIGGATGFVGRAMLACLNSIASVTGASFSVITLSRASNLCTGRAASSALHFSGDRAAFIKQCLDWQVSHYCHLATPTTLEKGAADLISTRESTIVLLEQMIEVARVTGRLKVLNASSGAVYGPNTSGFPASLSTQFSPLDWGDRVKDNYTRVKRESELLLSHANAEGLIEGTNARLFAFMGPGLPLDSHFAIGNFMSNAVTGKEIIVKNPIAVRAYLPREIMAACMVLALLLPKGELVHISSGSGLSLASYAQAIAEISGVPLKLSEGLRPDYYVGNAHPFEAFTENFNLEGYLGRWFDFEKLRLTSRL